MKYLIAVLLLLAASPPQANDAPRLNIDPDRITVSGLSAGAQMAHQLHIAWSDLFSGAAMIAGGPFGCAAGSVATAFARCMATTGAGLPVNEFSAAIRAAAEVGRVADPAALGDDRVWLFHGTLDQTVAAGISDALAALYADFVPAANTRYVNDIPAAHHFPANSLGHGCDASQPPFVGDCDYDAAGELLNHLYPGLAPPGDDRPGGLVQVALPGAAEAGLAEAAYLFMPAGCAEDGEPCALHLVLHGCAQSAAQIGTAFIEQSGYIGWAAANDIVLAFPQVVPGPANPYACWDWWGYTGASYLWREAPQMRVLIDWLKSMLSA
jgi:poly(3-hydroxybutyrate) depolymerase